MKTLTITIEIPDDVDEAKVADPWDLILTDVKDRALDPDWPGWADALCRQVDPELWFPERGQDGSGAKAICMTCPLMAECRAGALEHDERHGIWGGLSEQQRKMLRRKGPAATRASLIQAVEHVTSLGTQEEDHKETEAA